jgi:hypothetical protein
MEDCLRKIADSARRVKGDFGPSHLFGLFVAEGAFGIIPQEALALIGVHQQFLLHPE